MLPTLRQLLLKQWSELSIPRKKPEQLSFLSVRTDVNDGYALFLTFADDDQIPSLVVKIAREPDAATFLQNEWRLLSHLTGHLYGLDPLTSHSYCLQPILEDVVNGSQILVTTAPNGHPMQTSGDSVAQNFAIMTDFLAQFAQASRTPRAVMDVLDKMRFIVERLGQVFNLADQEIALISEWLDRWLVINEDGRVDCFATHGNLTRQNVWIDLGQPTIVNWERGQLAGIPLYDLFTFITSFQLPTSRTGTLRSYIQAFSDTYLTDSSYAGFVRETIATYCRKIRITPEIADALLGLYLVRSALNEYDQLLAAADRGYLPLISGSNGSNKRPYQLAIRDQLWINLLRHFIRENSRFRFGKGSGDQSGQRGNNMQFNHQDIALPEGGK